MTKQATRGVTQDIVAGHRDKLIKYKLSERLC
jgi:hypothetical protein